MDNSRRNDSSSIESVDSMPVPLNADDDIRRSSPELFKNVSRLSRNRHKELSISSNVAESLYRTISRFSAKNKQNVYNNSNNNNRILSDLESAASVPSIQSVLDSEDQFDIYNIYGEDKGPKEIDLQRQKARQTIRSVLRKRVTNLNPLVKSETIYDDEDIGENCLPTKKDGLEFADVDPELVTWDGDNDPEFPRNWPQKKKVINTILVSTYSFVSPVCSSMLAPAILKIAAEFEITNSAVRSLLVSIFVLAWAIAPLIVAPFSEIYGRRPVLNYSIWFMFAFNLGCCLAQNKTQMIIFRFLAGCGGATPLSVGAGVIGDLFEDKERNVWGGLYAIGPTLGPAVGPIIAGFVVEHLSWRWVFWIQLMINGVIAFIGLLFFRETYSPVLLKKRAKKLRKITKNPNLKTIHDIADGETVFGRFYLNITRPIKLLIFNPMVIGLGSFMALLYGLMYLLIGAFPLVWSVRYGFRIEIAGLMYITLGIGYLIGIAFWTPLTGSAYRKLVKQNNGIPKPEFRLKYLYLSGVIAPSALLVFGWSAEEKVHWMVPSISAGVFAFAVIDMFQCIQNYLIDMNPRFAASTVAAAAVFRSLFGFAFPLFSPYMFEDLGYGWGCTIFALIGFALGIPFPIYVYKNGEKLRNWTNKRMEKEQAKRDARNLERLDAKNKVEEQKVANSPIQNNEKEQKDLKNKTLKTSGSIKDEKSDNDKY
ncbi:MFS transporter [Ascoidea rubescens DSM 1968]|uniref:MFS general substrate transporter n=1 Tax=Ascoidea rubescens DSM 1968 TaxID=1344418 RepID=A0A1D2VE82_9ASCO|nr:MFS general substrate transporter [Ascoidea rubescens DSM 1968]ODV59892.1 MFS general substrate transporter [Ascoidea rubescens DSM 1968]